MAESCSFKLYAKTFVSMIEGWLIQLLEHKYTQLAIPIYKNLYVIGHYQSKERPISLKPKYI